MHMAVDPLSQVLSHRGSGKGIGTGAENRDEDRCRRNITALAVVDRYGVPGPIDKRLFSRLVIVPEHHVPGAAPALIQLAEPAIAVAIRMRFSILFPQQVKCQMLVCCKLGRQLREIDAGPKLPGGSQRPHRKQELVQLLLREVVGQGPA